MSDDAPLLDDLMPWSVRPPRIGRGWPLAADPACLKARWALLTRASGEAAKAALLRPTRARNLHTAVAQLPGHRTPTTALAREDGPCPEPVRVAHGPYDQQWLIPDHRLIDAARPELWRVADARQVFVVEQPFLPAVAEPAVVFSALLPGGRPPAGRPGRIRPLFRQPGAADPNLVPGLTDWLADLLGVPVGPHDVLAWVAAAARGTPRGCAVPLTADPAVWRDGLALGRRSLRLHTRGARYADPAAGPDRGKVRLPGGSRPYVRAPLPTAPKPGEMAYDAEERALRIGEGQVAPVSPEAWEQTAGGVRVLEAWYGERTARGEPGTLEALSPAAWTRTTTSELLELVSLLTLLAELRPALDGFGERLAGEKDTAVGTAELRTAGIVPVPEGRRRPASVLQHQEEGPDGQFALL